MALVENRFVCDLSKPVQAQVLKGNVFSLDNLGSRLSVLIYNNNEPATISGSITANCILPDGSTVNVNGGLTTEGDGSKAYVDVPQSCLLIPGILKIAIKCTSSSVITTLAAIVANVYMTKTDNVITPSQQIINDWNAAISASIYAQNQAIAAQVDMINGEVAARKSEDAKLQAKKVNMPLDEYNQPTNGTDGQALRTKGDGSTEWADLGLPTDQQTASAVQAWLNNHPEATTTVQDGAITEAKIAQSLINKKMRYSTIYDDTVSPINGYYIYDHCIISDISTETVLTGDHIFKDCTIGTLFIEGGTYEFYNCNFEYLIIGGSRIRCFSCTGKGINLIGNCNNSIIDGCTIVAETIGCIVISGGNSHNVKISNNHLTNNLVASQVPDNIHLQCINTHGVSNSVIENNYCEVGTERYAIDISGHGDSIRSSDNVIRNNIVKNGKIVLYATKNAICIGNCVDSSINDNGVYLDLDYGKHIICNNKCNNTYINIELGNPTLEVFIFNNICKSPSTGNAIGRISEYVSVLFANNILHGKAIDSSDTKTMLPQEMVYIPANSKLFIPTAYIIASEISSLTVGSIYNGGVVSNDTNFDRYVVYSKINIMNGKQVWWNQ